MPEFFEYDPLYGIRTDLSWDENEQKMTVHRTGDVQAALDHAKAMANDTDISKRGIKESWWQYCTIPPIEQLKLRAKGLDVGNPDHAKRIIEEINASYPYLKTTQGKMGGTPTQYYNTGVGAKRGRT